MRGGAVSPPVQPGCCAPLHPWALALWGLGDGAHPLHDATAFPLTLHGDSKETVKKETEQDLGKVVAEAAPATQQGSGDAGPVEQAPEQHDQAQGGQARLGVLLAGGFRCSNPHD